MNLQVPKPSSINLSAKPEGLRQVFDIQGTQRLQYPLLKEYTLNQIRDPTIVIFFGTFLNQGILESLGRPTKTAKGFDRSFFVSKVLDGLFCRCTLRVPLFVGFSGLRFRVLSFGISECLRFTVYDALNFVHILHSLITAFIASKV